MSELDNNTSTKAALVASARKDMEFFNVFSAENTPKESKSGSKLVIVSLVDEHNKLVEAWVSESQVKQKGVTPQLLAGSKGFFSFYKEGEEMFNKEICRDNDKIVKEFKLQPSKIELEARANKYGF